MNLMTNSVKQETEDSIRTHLLSHFASRDHFAILYIPETLKMMKVPQKFLIQDYLTEGLMGRSTCIQFLAVPIFWQWAMITFCRPNSIAKDPFMFTHNMMEYAPPSGLCLNGYITPCHIPKG